MFYRLDSEHYDSNYLYVDWETFDACLRPTDRDAGGRLCGKRARAAAGKVQAGSDKAKQLAADIRASRGMKSVGESNQASTARNAAKQAKQSAIRSKVLGLKPKTATVPDLEEMPPMRGKNPSRQAAGQKASRTKARKKAEREYLANNPAARKALERKAARSGNVGLQKKAAMAEQDEYSKKAALKKRIRELSKKR